MHSLFHLLPFLSLAYTDGAVLLYDGSFMSTLLREGTVLVCVNNTYGTVCDDYWDHNEASIVCGQLGYSRNGGFKYKLKFLL